MNAGAAGPARWKVLCLEVGFVLVVTFLLVLYGFRPNWDIDVFWNIKVGEWIVQNLRLPHTDIFSATDQTRLWTPFQWLYEVGVFLLHRYAGFSYVRYMHGALFLVGSLLYYASFRRRLASRSAAAVLFALLLVLTEDRIRVRPGVFNFLFLALVLPYLVEPGPRPIRATVFVALLSFIWANVHAGGSLLVATVLGAATCGALLVWWRGEGSFEARRDLLALGSRFVVSFGLMCIAPGFLHGTWTAMSMYQGSWELIPEWHPPVVYFWSNFTGPLCAHHVLAGALPYALLFASGGFVSTWVIRAGLDSVLRSHALPYVLASFALLVVGVKSARFIFLDVPAVFVFVLPFREHLRIPPGSIGPRFAAMLVAGLLVFASYEYSVLRQRGSLSRALSTLRNDNEPDSFPERASDAMVLMGLSGRIFHLTRWGGYLIYRHYPRCTVFTDGRGNFTEKEKTTLIATHKPYERYEELEKAWRRYHFDIVIFPPPVFPLLMWDTRRWVLVYEDDVAQVFVRNDHRNKRNIARALAYWREMGVSPEEPGLDAFQRYYQQVLGMQYLGRAGV